MYAIMDAYLSNQLCPAYENDVPLISSIRDKLESVIDDPGVLNSTESTIF